MADIRINRAKKNIIISLCCQFITVMCGIIVPKLMLDAFGSEVYGATASINQFLSYIALMEGGIGGVARAVLYKPLADRDGRTISAIMGEMRSFFRFIAYIFLGYVLVIACSFKSIAGVEALDRISTFMLVIVMSISIWGQYYIGISNSVLLRAAQRSYVIHSASIISTIANTILVVVLVSMNCNVIVVKLASSVVYIMRPVMLWVYVRKNYPLEKVPKSGEKYLTQKWSGLSQHIAYFLHSNTDIVVLTCLADLKTVAIYSIYNMIIVHVQDICISFVSGMEALFGDMLVKKEFDRFHKIFGVYETMISVIAVVLFAATSVLIVPFVRIYTAGITDTNYDVPVFAILMVISSMLYYIRMPYNSVVVAAGHFKQTRLAAYGEVVINVVLSILLFTRFGLVGVAVGTIAATAFRLIYYVIYLSHEICNRRASLFVKRFLVNCAAFVLAFAAGRLAISRVVIGNYMVWALCGVMTVLITAVVTAAVNMLFYRGDCVNLVKRMLK